MITRPPSPKPLAPPPPAFGGRSSYVQPRPEAFTYVDQGSYKMAMRSEYDPEWRARLRDAGWPTDVVVIDFETFFDSEYSLRKKSISTIEYIHDRRFEILGCSCLIMNAPFIEYENQTRWFNGEDGVRDMLSLLRQLYGPDLERCTVVIQNARFDAAVLAFKYGLHPKYLVDTLGLARHWNSRTDNDLDTLCKREGLTNKGDTSKFLGWTNRRRAMLPKKGRGKNAPDPLPLELSRMTREQQRELGDYANNDVMREWEIFTIYLPRLSRPSIELRLIQHTIELFTKPIIQVDYARAEQLIAGMSARMAEVVDAVHLTPTELRGRHFDDYMAELLRKYGGDEHARHFMKPAKCEQGWKIASANADTEREELLAHPDPHIRAVMEAKVAVHSWPSHISRVQRIVAQAKANGGKLCVPLKYGGAHTLRWAGGEGINLQNLGERNKEELIRAVRELLIPPGGWSFVIVDLSNIEGRGAVWAAGQESALQQYRDDDELGSAASEDVYTRLASKILGFRCRKPIKEGGIPEVESRFKQARGLGKVGILGCGYGMGPNKAIGYAAGMGVEVDLPMAEQIVKTYREDNHCVVQLWKDLERAFLYTFKYQNACEVARGIRFEPLGNEGVTMVLPTGHEIKYHKVRLSEGKYGGDAISVYNESEHKWSHVWGGHLVENLVQGFCRDILADALLRCEDRGVRIALHVHDELVACVPDEEAERTEQIMMEELRRVLPWAENFPLNAESTIKKRYGGH